MENLQQIVTPLERTMMLKQQLGTDATVGFVRNLLAEVAEMAYLAGANGLDIKAQQLHTANLKDTGEVLVKARNYVKAKGLRI